METLEDIPGEDTEPVDTLSRIKQAMSEHTVDGKWEGTAKFAS